MKLWKAWVGMALTLCLLAGGLTLPTRAAEDTEVLQSLALLSVMNGDEQGDLQLERPVKRSEFAKMCVAASHYREQGQQPTGLSPFFDVSGQHWAAGYIAVAQKAGWVLGDLYGAFRPDASITLAEGATVVLRMLGYTESDFTGRWPSGQMERYAALELDTDIAARSGEVLTRRDCAQLIYNLLGAETKTGAVYCTTLGYAVNAEGNIDVVQLLAKTLDGPVIYSGADWVNAIGFTPKQVFLNGKAAAATDIAPYHVLYFQRETRAVYAYSTRHTGAITAIAPHSDAPQSVTVGGVTYPLGTGQAALSLSAQGDFRVGDTVTLLMGRGETVAAVIDAQVLNDVRYGVVQRTGQTVYAAGGGTYYADYVDVLATDGINYRYEVKEQNWDEGDLVQLSGGQVSALRERSLGGTVKRSTLGETALSPTLEILDAWENTGVSVPLSRLIGCTLSKSDVRFAAYDSAGRLSHLILDDYTGDIHGYGLLTETEHTPTGAFSYVNTYTYFAGGKEQTYTAVDVSFPVSTGGVRLCWQEAGLDGMFDLNSVRVRQKGEHWVSDGSRRYTLDDKVQVYLRRDGSYYLTDWSLLSDSADLTAWYDAPDSEGGRVRLLVAK